MQDPLMAISPIDGRYFTQVERFEDYFSEFALIRYRVKVEVEYFIALCEILLPQLKSVNPDIFTRLRELYWNFSITDAQEIKDIEKTTNHDVKAVEYFIKKHFKLMGLDQYIEFIHFGLTSQDINNTAIPLSLMEGVRDVYLPELDNIMGILKDYSKEWVAVPMLAHTHGQPASPTRLGKEISVFNVRLF